MQRESARQPHNRIQEHNPAGAANAGSGVFYFAYYYASAIRASVALRASEA